MTDQKQIHKELEKAASLLSTASDLMQHGRLVDISSLERMVSGICSGINRTGYPECSSLKPSVQALLAKLETFESEMTSQYGFLENASKGTIE